MVFLEKKRNGHRSGEANMAGVRETVEGSAALLAISDELNFVKTVNKHWERASSSDTRRGG